MPFSHVYTEAYATMPGKGYSIYLYNNVSWLVTIDSFNNFSDSFIFLSLFFLPPLVPLVFFLYGFWFSVWPPVPTVSASPPGPIWTWIGLRFSVFSSSDKFKRPKPGGGVFVGGTGEFLSLNILISLYCHFVFILLFTTMTTYPSGDTTARSIFDLFSILRLQKSE